MGIERECVWGGAVSLSVICFSTSLLLSLLSRASHRTGQHLRLYVGQGCISGAGESFPAGSLGAMEGAISLISGQIAAI